MKPYYEHAGITIYHGDCREILPQLPNSALLLTDPPYGVNLGDHAGAQDNRLGCLTKGRYLSYEDSPENFRAVVVPGVFRKRYSSFRRLQRYELHRMQLYPRSRNS